MAPHEVCSTIWHFAFSTCRNHRTRQSAHNMQLSRFMKKTTRKESSKLKLDKLQIKELIETQLASLHGGAAVKTIA